MNGSCTGVGVSWWNFNPKDGQCDEPSYSHNSCKVTLTAPDYSVPWRSSVLSHSDSRFRIKILKNEQSKSSKGLNNLVWPHSSPPWWPWNPFQFELSCELDRLKKLEIILTKLICVTFPSNKADFFFFCRFYHFDKLAFEQKSVL